MGLGHPLGLAALYHGSSSGLRPRFAEIAHYRRDHYRIAY